MSWKERILEGAIETPDYIRHVFKYRDLEKDTDKKISKHRFGDIENSLVQDFGIGEVSYPMTIYFSGENYDEDANKFDESSGKKGICILEHPIYGVKDVIIEKVKRQDSLATSGGQAIFILTLTETIKEEIPSPAEMTDFGILSTLNDLYAAVANAYNNSFIATAIDYANYATQRIEAFVNEFAAAVDKITTTVNQISSGINAAKRYITDNIDTLLSAPLDLADAVQNLIDTPAQAIASVKQRLSIYKEQYLRILNDIPSGADNQDKKNQCAEKQLFLTSLLGVMCKITLYPNTGGNAGGDAGGGNGNDAGDDTGGDQVEDTGFQTRSDASATALELVNILYEIQEYLDELQIETENGTIQTSFVVSDEVTRTFKKVVSLTAKNLVRLSFELKQERITTLLRDRNIIDLSYELYGTSDNSTLDKLIKTNNLSGDDIIIIPTGRAIKYYV